MENSGYLIPCTKDEIKDGLVCMVTLPTGFGSAGMASFNVTVGVDLTVNDALALLEYHNVFHSTGAIDYNKGFFSELLKMYFNYGYGNNVTRKN